MIKFTFLWLIIVIQNLNCEKYDNHVLLRGYPTKEEHVEFYKNLIQLSSINFWQGPGSINHNIDFTLNSEDLATFEKNAAKSGINFTTLLEDVQRAFDMQTIKPYSRRKLETFDWNSFYSIRDIYNWLYDLNKEYPTQSEFFKIGTTYENRDIKAFKIVLNNDTTTAVFVEGGIHAREWISPAVVTYFINALLKSQRSNDTMLRQAAETYVWYFVPVVNPDGYEYSHSKDRLWRKNRHEFDDGFGVDLNRNFGYAYATTGVSHKVTDDIYCGPEAFSELETKTLVSFLKSISKNLKFYIAFHSYGQYILIPHAHTKLHLENYDEMKKKAHQAAAAIKKIHGTKYTIGNAFEALGYTTSGVSDSWAKTVFRIPYALTFELRDGGRYGFALPTEQILPTCEETLVGVVSLLTMQPERTVKLRNSEACSFSDISLLFLCNIVTFVVVR